VVVEDAGEDKGRTKEVFDTESIYRGVVRWSAVLDKCEG